MWQPGWKGGLEENGYMYMHGWVPLLLTWNHHNTGYWLYSRIKQKKKSWTLLHRGPTSSGQKDTSILVTAGRKRWSWTDFSQEPTPSQESVYKTLLGKSLSRDLGENRGSRLKKGKTSRKTGSSCREPRSVKPAWDYVLPWGQGVGLSDSHPS